MTWVNRSCVDKSFRYFHLPDMELVHLCIFILVYVCLSYIYQNYTFVHCLKMADPYYSQYSFSGINDILN